MVNVVCIVVLKIIHKGPGPLPRRTAAPSAEERDKRSAALLSRLAAEPEGYAECYPGLREMDDAIDDSDDEVDYTKMDAGNKKGPIGKLFLLLKYKNRLTTYNT